MQKWSEKATVQGAIVGAIGLIIASLITVAGNIVGSSGDNETKIAIEQVVSLDGKDREDINKILQSLETIAAARQSTEKNHRFVLFLVDVSGSMTGNVGNVARSAIKKLKARYKYDRLAIMSFGVTTTEILPFGNYQDDQVDEFIDRIRFGDSETDFALGIEQSLRALRKVRGEQKLLVIVTDAIFDVSRSDAMRMDMQIFEENGVSVDLLYVGNDNPLGVHKRIPWIDQIILIGSGEEQ